MRCDRSFSAVILAAALASGCGIDDRNLRPDTGESGGSDGGGGHGGRATGGDGRGGAPPGGTSTSGGRGGGNGAGHGGERPNDGCPAGVRVLSSDGTATQVALADLDGVITTEAFISSESTKMTEGLSFALSGDMILPSTPPESGRMVLLDRTGANPITFADGQDATVTSQLVVGTGFDALPSDYIEVGANRAFVSRFADNPEPGRLAHDRGGDLLVIDSAGPDLIGSIELPRPDEVAPGPAGMASAGGRVWVGLARTGSAPESSGDSMLAGVSIEREEVEVEHVLDGLRGCGRPAVSPSGELLAIACSGGVGADGESEDAGASALVLFDPLGEPPAEIRRFRAGAIAGQAIQSDVVFASERLVLLKTQDAAGGESRNNRWLAFDLEDQSTQRIAEASPDEAERSRGTVYGAMSCAPGCSDVCLLTNAGDSVIERVRVSETGELELLEPIRVSESPELAPRGFVLY